MNTFKKKSLYAALAGVSALASPALPPFGGALDSLDRIDLGGSIRV